MSIPVRNIWWLMLYASDLGKEAAPSLLAAEDLPEEIPDLVAEILARAVEQRQRRQLSTAFRQREAVLSRVRGRIDHLSTARRQLLALPTEEAGPNAVLDPQRCVHWLRSLYEKAIGGFYRFHLDPAHWRVQTGKHLNWWMEDASSGIAAVFPSMRTDIVIDRHDRPQRLVIDTRFTGVYGHQLYAYLRSQEGQGDPWADAASGLLLHPAIAADVDEAMTIQGHRLRFATVDLTASHAALKARLLALLAQA
jgi:hypothetical protein